MEKIGYSNKILFSILMTNFNNEKYIETAIKSVISQTYPDWELIIVDDQSTDNSIEKITPYLNDKRIRLIQHKKNLGYSAALKTAIDNSIYDIIGILDSDDKLHEKALEIMAKAYKENPECGFIYSTMWICDSYLKNCILNRDIQETIPNKPSSLMNIISHFKTFTKKAYKKTTGFDPNQKKAVDKDIIYKLEEVTGFKFINRPLYYYRRHESGISQDKNQFNAKIYHYISKCKTFQRRLKINLPNFTLRELYIEYYKITFHKIVLTYRFLSRLFKISQIIKKVIQIFTFIQLKIRKPMPILLEMLIDKKINYAKN